MARDRRRLRRLGRELATRYPDIPDAEEAIRRGDILIDGRPACNPDTLVRTGISIRFRGEAPLRGEAKLRAALAAFAVPVRGRVALDLGAAAGGFTRVLLAAGAARVYAVDAGHGQLTGSLRADARVVSLERTNLAELDRALPPDAIDLVTVDLSYLALALAAGQLGGVVFAPDAEMVALVKPMYELRLARPPSDAATLDAAVDAAARGLARAGWLPLASIESPVRGGRGAVERLLHARLAT